MNAGKGRVDHHKAISDSDFQLMMDTLNVPSKDAFEESQRKMLVTGLLLLTFVLLAACSNLLVVE